MKTPITLTLSAALLTTAGCMNQEQSPAVSPPLKPIELTVEAPATEPAVAPRTLALSGPARDADLAINRAETAVRNAQANGAVLYATTKFQRAKDGLMMARSWQQQRNWRAARQEANRATRSAVDALQDAKPSFRAAQAHLNEIQAREALAASLNRFDRLQPVVTTDGVEVTVPGTFLPLDDGLTANGASALESVGRVARSHPQFELTLIASQTDGLSPTDALIMGQNRAIAAENYLEDLGIAPDRVDSGRLAPTGRTLTIRFEPAETLAAR